jgi:hypothetical protein
MAILNTKQYDQLERAIVDGRRIAVHRSGNREVVVVPKRLRMTGGREMIEASHPTTGDRLELFIDEIDGFEVVR